CAMPRRRRPRPGRCGLAANGRGEGSSWRGWRCACGLFVGLARHDAPPQFTAALIAKRPQNVRAFCEKAKNELVIDYRGGLAIRSANSGTDLRNTPTR